MQKLMGRYTCSLANSSDAVKDSVMSIYSSRTYVVPLRQRDEPGGCPRGWLGRDRGFSKRQLEPLTSCLLIFLAPSTTQARPKGPCRSFLISSTSRVWLTVSPHPRSNSSPEGRAAPFSSPHPHTDARNARCAAACQPSLVVPAPTHSAP
jgi:hypothetical protein